MLVYQARHSPLQMCKQEGSSKASEYEIQENMKAL